ncbi:MAG: GNAT family N-acetyltransferase, partial [Acidobacteria bacterium]|nr:GNAT family N-acetyltransferase [Acidobacteriota bacterium]
GKVRALVAGQTPELPVESAFTIGVPADWFGLVASDPSRAVNEQMRIRRQFQEAFGRGLVARGFERSDTGPKYLLFEN